MQRIIYEKEIDLLNELKEMVSLTVDESIDYKMEDDGIRAIGSLIIKGEYLSDEKKRFLENIDLDILATRDKLIDQHEFNLKVEDFNYNIVDGNLNLKVEVGIYGVVDGEDRYLKVDDPIDEIESLVREIDNHKEVVDIEDLQEKVYETKVKEVNEEDNDDIGAYYLHVVSNGDSYDSIAREYNMNELVIREYNHNIELDMGQIIIIPYDSKDNCKKV